MANREWVELVTFASGFEADIAMARLEAEGIPAVRDNHAITGIFGPGFQGATAFGVTVRVPSDALDAARSLLEDFEEDGDEGFDDDESDVQ
jgi:hypothetical protein